MLCVGWFGVEEKEKEREEEGEEKYYIVIT